MTFKLTFPGPGAPGHTRRDLRARAKQYTIVTAPSPFSLPLTRKAAFVLEGLDAVEAVEAIAVSEAW
jgi:hypothetical protein